MILFIFKLCVAIKAVDWHPCNLCYHTYGPGSPSPHPPSPGLASAFRCSV
jgi:hypothetical protein